MARTPVRKRAIASACHEYSISSRGECEVMHLLNADRDAAKWMSSIRFGKTEVHHIYGRGEPEQYDYFSNLILIDRACHLFGHDVCPPKLEICCLLAKLRMHRSMEQRTAASGISMFTTGNRLHWNPQSLGLICGCIDLAGRVSLIRDKLRGDLYQMYADEVLTGMVSQ